jgi:short-subunit dehydrogenase involved in D-alanine esterification of teichoic acids
MASILKTGNTALITGGASGIGLALARKCYEAGMKVLVADWNDAALQAAETNVGSEVVTFKIDVGKLEDWAVLKAKVEKEFGGELHSLGISQHVPY